MTKPGRKLWWLLCALGVLGIGWGGYGWFTQRSPRDAHGYKIPFTHSSTRSSLPSQGQPVATQARAQRHVIAISIDGLRSDAVTRLGARRLPTLFRLRREGASTLNARTDHHFTITLPNHASMLTGRWVEGDGGHGYKKNWMPGQTLHANKGAYVASVFDVLHDHGLHTALFASKRKFILFPLSYGGAAGAPDQSPPDHGRNKLDLYAISHRDQQTLPLVLQALRTKRPHFTFIHFRGPDTKGHWRRWMSDAYLAEVERQDQHLAQIFACIANTPGLAGHTTVLITTDHGGSGFSHRRSGQLAHFRIPFWAWGKGVARGADLYQLNAKHRSEPGDRRIPPSAARQPIRNGDIANVVTSLFRLPPVPGSQMGHRTPLRLQ